jgi:hypothetical protein
MPDPSAWSVEQQQQFMQALMGGGAFPPPGGAANPNNNMNNNPFAALLGGGAGGFPPLPADAAGMGMGADAGDVNNPFAAMMGGGASANGAQAGVGVADKPRTRAQRLLPAVHLLAVWALLAYFVVWREPAVVGAGFEGHGAAWRWTQLARRSPKAGGWSVQLVVGILR